VTPRLLRFDVLAFIGLACALLICALMRSRGHHRAAQVVWCVAILLGSVPFIDAQTHPLWTRVRWIPFWTWNVKDAVVNILLYVPLGFFFKRERHAVSTVVGFAAVLSLAAELSQLFSHSRFPATTDVVCNIIGASAGAFIAQVTERSPTGLGDALKSAIRRCMA
jgi:glycopeptide antibiotics resistance protein